MTIKVGETKESLNVLDFLGFRPVLDDLNLYGAIMRPSGDSIYLRNSTGSDVELTFVCTDKKSISMELLHPITPHNYADKLQLVLHHDPHSCHTPCDSRSLWTYGPHLHSDLIEHWPFITPYSISHISCYALWRWHQTPTSAFPIIVKSHAYCYVLTLLMW